MPGGYVRAMRFPIQSDLNINHNMKKLLFIMAVGFTTASFAQLTPTVVKDVNPSGDGCDNDFFLAEMNGKALYFAMPDGNRTILYSSDGTSAGTNQVKNVGHSINNTEQNFFRFNNLFFWAGCDSANYGSDVQVLRTDGTASGTFALKTFNPVSSSAFSAGARFIANSNTVFFIAQDTSSSYLCRTDGSVNGTYKLYKFQPVSSLPDVYSIVNDKLLFNIDDDLYTSDGTVSGTQLYYKSVSEFSPAEGVVMGGSLYFGYSHDLWKADGIAPPTKVKDGYENGGLIIGNKLYYVANDGTTGQELWVTNGTASGTTVVKDIVPGTSGSSATILGKAGNKVIFTANTVAQGTEVWVSDGTAGGTFLLKDICVGSGSSYIKDPATDEGKGVVYFIAENCPQSEQLYRTDGTVAGTYQVNSFALGSYTFTPLTVIDGLVYYSCISTGIGHEMHVTNGLPGGTRRYDLNPGSGYSNSSRFTKAGGKIFFKARNTQYGEELWSMNMPVISSISESEVEGAYLEIYPNPAGSHLNVKIEAQSIEKVTIYGTNGQLLLETADPAHIDVAALYPGMYIAEVKTKTGVARKRWVKM
jgi:ELWxxDGT repeat protein